ncbi:MAG: NAD+ synthase [Phycisphaerales bacterium]|nr:NAD+ synthase [Phycisphaerae bacterium]NNF44004.1 NAD+ synthase [Phycisphaerales bacterium]NNM26306.1 NAD+ synthase [Phycisphaerales bacterium]
MRIALAQLNPIVGDVAGNTDLVLASIERARRDDADLLVTPELALLGYPPRDLILREGIVEAAEAAVGIVAAAAGEMTVLVGHPRRVEPGVRGVRNSVSACRDDAILAVSDKRLLPGYDIFDEDRYFDAGRAPCVIEVAGRKVGVLVCEDLWRAGDVNASPEYDVDPAAEAVAAGAEILVSLNASPFVLKKFARHRAIAREVARRLERPLVAVNQVGGQDDLVFDGRSFAVRADGRVIAQLPGWQEDTVTVDLAADAAITATPPEDDADLFHALVTGVRDYCHKTGHERALVGLSGGIDSALTAAIAAAALGAGNVSGLMLPSRYSSDHSVRDATQLAQNLRLAACPEVAIEPAHEVVRTLLTPTLPGDVKGVTDENIQARLRGMLLMAVSNATGALVLATGNKSELAVGYATLYGDMAGALAVLGDVLKTRVYDVARWINANPAAGGFATPPIPLASIEKPPSAELRPDQTDQDSLPPYEVLDPIIAMHVEHEAAVERVVVETGADPGLVQRIIRMIDAAEYKRHQAAIVLKVTQRAFGRGRPMPMAMRVTTALPPVQSSAHAHPPAAAAARQPDRRR